MHTVNKPVHHGEHTARFMTIDPGLNGHTGWAVFHRDRNSPDRTGISKARPKLGDWYHQCHDIATNITAWAAGPTERCDQVFIEMPEFWSGSVKSQTAVQSGSLFKLSFLVGCLYGRITDRNVPVTIFPPREWKGQLSKDQVDRRIKYTLGTSYPEHISDAVGMGMWVKGVL